MTGSNATTIESFLDMMSAERGAGANTLAAYRRDLLDFAGHRAGKGGSARDASRDDIKSYLEHLSRAGTSSATQARRLSAGLREGCASIAADEKAPTSRTRGSTGSVGPDRIARSDRRQRQGRLQG